MCYRLTESKAMNDAYPRILHELDRFATAMFHMEMTIPMTSAHYEMNVNIPAHHRYNKLLSELVQAQKCSAGRVEDSLRRRMDARELPQAMAQCRELLLFDSANKAAHTALASLAQNTELADEANHLLDLLPLGEPRLEMRTQAYPLQVHWNEDTESYWISHNYRIEEMDRQWTPLSTVLDLDFFRSPFMAFHGDTMYCNSFLTNKLYKYSLSQKRVVESTELDIMIGIPYAMPDGTILASCYDDTSDILIHFDKNLNEIRRSAIAPIGELVNSGDVALAIVDGSIVALSNTTVGRQELVDVDLETLQVRERRTIDSLPTRVFSVIPHGEGFLVSGISHIAILDKHLRLVHFKHQPDTILNRVQKIAVMGQDTVFGLATHSREIFSYSLDPNARHHETGQ